MKITVKINDKMITTRSNKQVLDITISKPETDSTITIDTSANDCLDKIYSFIRTTLNPSIDANTQLPRLAVDLLVCWSELNDLAIWLAKKFHIYALVLNGYNNLTLSHFNHLESLSISNFSFLKEKSRAFVESFGILKFPQLKELSINGCQLGDEDFNHYIKPLLENPQLTYLNLSDNDLTNYTVYELAIILVHNERLEILNLSENCIDLHSMKCLLATLKTDNFTLLEIHLTHHQKQFEIPDPIKSQLSTYLSRNLAINSILNDSIKENKISEFIIKIRSDMSLENQNLAAQPINHFLGKDYSENLFFCWVFLYPLTIFNPEKYKNVSNILAHSLLLNDDPFLTSQEKFKLMLILLGLNQSTDLFLLKLAINGHVNKCIDLTKGETTNISRNNLISIRDITSHLNSRNIILNEYLTEKVVFEEFVLDSEVGSHNFSSAEEAQKYLTQIQNRFVQLKKDLLNKVYYRVTSYLLEQIEEPDDYRLILWKEHLQHLGKYCEIYSQLQKNNITVENWPEASSLEAIAVPRAVIPKLNSNPFQQVKLPFFSNNCLLLKAKGEEEFYEVNHIDNEIEPDYEEQIFWNS